MASIDSLAQEVIMKVGFLFILGLPILTYALNEHVINKRVLPINKNCDPNSGACRKGDWIAENIADCEYDRSLFHPFSCDAQNDAWSSWTVDVAQDDRCKPVSGKRFTCGAAGTNTRCVCSDTNLAYNPGINTCQCQYWPNKDVGAHSPAFCTGYYTGGTSTVHHWACCNNCNDPTSNTCNSNTWQGGSSGDYCGSCGQNTGGGRVKYYFNCGSCDDQQACSSKCDSKGYDFPGACWKWLDCFKGCCLASATQPRNKRDVSDITFCGDDVCSGNETPDSCPGDCCYKMNSANCTSDVSKCTPECCHAPTCCLEEDDKKGGINKGVVIGLPVTFTVLVIALVVIFAAVCYLYKKRKQSIDYNRI